MLLLVHVTRVLFLVLAGNSALTMGFYWSYTLLTLVACSYALLVCDSMGMRLHWGMGQHGYEATWDSMGMRLQLQLSQVSLQGSFSSAEILVQCQFLGASTFL